MDKVRAKRIRRYISWGLLAVLVAVLAVMPLLASGKAEDDGIRAVMKSGSVAYGTITTAIHGGGTLTEDASLEITIPSGVKLTEFLVENGQSVAEGEPLAAVDKISVMTAIAQVQKTLDYLAEEMENAEDEEGADKIKAKTAGRVKILYAEEGDDVQDVILEHGSLAVLSLDGRMGLDVETDAALSVGDSVVVTLEEDEEVTGRVESTLGDTVIVTIPDNGYAVDAAARVSTSDGDYLGYGKLYIRNPWHAMAYYGTVDAVKVKENETVSAGEVLMTLENTSHSTQYELLLAQRQEYEEVMQELFQMYRSGAVTAPCDGTVSGVDEDSAYLLSAQDNGGWVIQLLGNITQEDLNPDTDPEPEPQPEPEPDEEEEVVIYHYFGRISEAGTLLVDYGTCYTNVTNPAGLAYHVDNMTSPGILPGTITNLSGGSANVSVGDILMLTTSQEYGSFVSAVIVVDAPDASDGEEGDGMEDKETEGDLSGENDASSTEGQTGAMSGMMGGMGGGSVAVQPTFEPYDLTESVILTVTPRDAMTLDITVDEMDVGKLQPGQPAEVTVSALIGEQYAGEITKIGTSENSGGHTKFTVTITMARDGDMLSGMSASASMELETVENVLTIPAAALNSVGSDVFVYTGYDEKNDAYGNPVSVAVGVSDGEMVEILSGLEEGDVFYYAYYEPEE